MISMENNTQTHAHKKDKWIVKHRVMLTRPEINSICCALSEAIMIDMNEYPHMADDYKRIRTMFRTIRDKIKEQDDSQ